MVMLPLLLIYLLILQKYPTPGMSQTMVQMTMIVTQHLHHAGSYRQFWTEQQMVLTSMSHLILSHWIPIQNIGMDMNGYV